MIKLRYFASLRESVGSDAEELDLGELAANPNSANPGTTVAAVRTHLAQRGSTWADAFAEDRRILAAVNQDMARPETAVKDGDELAFFPPVTGG
jgi:molybdopterin synthase sulfur carrier subunit